MYLQKSVSNSRCICIFVVLLKIFLKILWRNLSPVEQGSPTPGPWFSTSLWPVRNWAAQAAGKRAKLHLRMCRIYVACEIIPASHPPVHGKIVCMKPVPGIRKFGDRHWRTSTVAILSKEENREKMFRTNNLPIRWRIDIECSEHFMFRFCDKWL